MVRSRLPEQVVNDRTRTFQRLFLHVRSNARSLALLAACFSKGIAIVGKLRKEKSSNFSN